MIHGPLVLQQGAVGNAVDQVIGNVITFVPRLIWALIVLVVGIGVTIFVVGRVRDGIEDSDWLADEVAAPVATGVKVLLYFFVATIALGELGVGVGILGVFIDGIAFGLGAALALLVGIGLGWGSKDYVAEHVDEWVESATDGDRDEGPTGDSDES